MLFSTNKSKTDPSTVGNTMAVSLHHPDMPPAGFKPHHLTSATTSPHPMVSSKFDKINKGHSGGKASVPSAKPLKIGNFKQKSPFSSYVDAQFNQGVYLHPVWDQI